MLKEKLGGIPSKDSGEQSPRVGSRKGASGNVIGSVNGRSVVKIVRSGKNYVCLLVYCKAAPIGDHGEPVPPVESRRQHSIGEEVRAELAREIHDELGQILTLLKMNLASIRESSAESAAASLEVELESIEQGVNAALQAVRRISTSLRPSMLSDGLAAGLDWLARSFQERTGIKCKLDNSRDTLALDPELSAALFRIAQESLTNIARHSEGSEVRIKLERRQDQVILGIRDNGRGIRFAELEKGSFGLRGMWERATAWGGSVSILGISGTGTLIRVRVPLPRFS